MRVSGDTFSTAQRIFRLSEFLSHPVRNTPRDVEAHRYV